MSLINDALKRAQGQAPSSAPPSGNYLPPRGSSGQRGQAPNKFLIVVLALAAAGAVYTLFFNKSAPIKVESKKSRAQEVGDVSTPTPAPAAEEPAGVKPKVGLFDAFTKPPPPIVESPVAETPVVAEKPAPPPAAPAAPAEPTMPKLRLEGILVSSKKGNTALINGTPLKVGEKISGATVVAIEKESVKLRFYGKDILLAIQ